MIGYDWHIHYAPYRGGYEVYLKADNGKRVVTNIEFTVSDFEEGECIVPPLILVEKEAQQIIDQLWQAGLRPRNGEGTDAQVNSIKEHLSDMRSIVFKQLKMEKDNK